MDGHHHEEAPRAYHIHARFDVPSSVCHSCLRFGYLRRYGLREQVYLDLPMHGRRVAIHVQRQRYQCANCQKVTIQPLPDMDDQRKMTKRLTEHIGREALQRTFISIAGECGMDEKTVRNVFKDYAAQLDANHQVVTPAWLGIDELTLLRRPRCIMTNLREATVVSLLASRTQHVVVSHLARLPQRDSVEIVSMDMWAPYREARRAALPQARIVVDKFHVVRMANQALEVVRKTLRADLSDKQRRALMHDRFALLKRADDLTDRDRLTLDLWTSETPLLAKAYEAKETFYGIWDVTSRVDAEARYADWFLAPRAGTGDRVRAADQGDGKLARGDFCVLLCSRRCRDQRDDGGDQRPGETRAARGTWLLL